MLASRRRRVALLQRCWVLQHCTSTAASYESLQPVRYYNSDKNNTFGTITDAADDRLDLQSGRAAFASVLQPASAQPRPTVVLQLRTTPLAVTRALRASRETLSRLQAHIIDRHERPKQIALIALWINKTTVLCNQ